MTKKYCAFFIFLFAVSFNGQGQQNSVKQIRTEVLLSDKISIRALTIDKQKLYYAADANKYGSIELKTDKKTEFKISADTLKLEFRSIAQTKNHIFILNVANPAMLYKIDKKTMTPKLVYKEQNQNVFYDGMQFYNNKNGIAMGDPTDNCLAILTTKDGGETWQKQSCANSPNTVEGEMAFAASNTNLVIKNQKVWTVSGGKQARVFFSDNFAKSWQSYSTPIIQGETMTGIFSADFYDHKNGIIVGGNYDKLNQNFGNKAITTDGGKTWKLIAENQAFGYASCVQYIPKSNAKGIVTVGANGVFISYNAGLDWTQISDNKTLYVLKFINKYSFIAAGKNQIIRFSNL